jgi:hypothetical protein
MRQEGVLLGLVEAVHFVHEQHRSAALLKAALGLGQDQANLRQSGQHRRDGAEFSVRILRQ